MSTAELRGSAPVKPTGSLKSQPSGPKPHANGQPVRSPPMRKTKTPDAYDRFLQAARVAVVWAVLTVSVVAAVAKYLLATDLRPDTAALWSVLAALVGV